MSVVAMNDFRAEPEALVQAQIAACERVIRSGWWILGKEVAAFEAKWADRVGVPYAVGCGNGMDAIELGLRALEIGAGDEVVTTPMTAFATVLAVLRAGAVPVLADIDPRTAMLDPQSVQRCIGERTRAILLVHLYGQMGPVEPLAGLARERGIHLIEDCAQAHGASAGGRQAGSFGAFGAWSFYPTKNLGAIGDGGALSTESADLADKVRTLRNYGQTVRYHHPHIGMNSRLDEMQAAIVLERLQYLEPWTTRRRQIAALYSRHITHPSIGLLALPGDPQRHVHHLFVVTCAERDRLAQHLKDAGVDTLIHYPVPIHHQEPCRTLQRDPAGLGRAEAHAATCLSLPCHPGLSDHQVEQVIAAVNGFRS
ncbi:MAG: DegT/DnrJ/EryC1/StrS family aminotransferase [Burkholderiaceae bacterium]